MLCHVTWPLQSPDQSPNEIIWDEMDHKEKARGPKELWEVLQDCWKSSSGDYPMKVTESTPKSGKQQLKQRVAILDTSECSLTVLMVSPRIYNEKL